jgi:hypothetical protein
MYFDITQRVHLASQPITLFQFASGEFALFFKRKFGDFPVDNLNLALPTITDTATNADDIHVEFAGAIEQGLVSLALATPSDGFKVDIEQESFSFSWFCYAQWCVAPY